MLTHTTQTNNQPWCRSLSPPLLAPPLLRAACTQPGHRPCSRRMTTTMEAAYNAINVTSVVVREWVERTRTGTQRLWKTWHNGNGQRDGNSMARDGTIARQQWWMVRDSVSAMATNRKRNGNGWQWTARWWLNSDGQQGAMAMDGTRTNRRQGMTRWQHDDNGRSKRNGYVDSTNNGGHKCQHRIKILNLDHQIN